MGPSLAREPVIGSLFSGYGGLDMGVRLALGGGRVVWHSDIDKGANKILAHRYPTIPNLGDLTKVDWTQVTPIDVLTGGFPCQDLSHAGKRAGMKPGTRSGLWEHMAYAIATLRPRLVVAENVRGLLSAEANSDMEPCPWCLGDGGDVHALRALGAVLGDLAELGYDARWYGLRAADVGAPHGRFRVFVVAHPRDGAAVDAGDDAGAAAAGGRPGEVAGVAEPAGDRGLAVVPDVQGRPGPVADSHAERPVVPEPGVGGAAEPDGVHRPRLRVVGGTGPGADAEGGDAGGAVVEGGLPPQPRGVGERPGGEGDAPGAAGRDVAVPDARGERHGRGQDARGVGRVERGGDDAAPDARAAAVDRGPGLGPVGEPEGVAEAWRRCVCCGLGADVVDGFDRCDGGHDLCGICVGRGHLLECVACEDDYCWYCGRPELLGPEGCGNCGAGPEPRVDGCADEHSPASDPGCVHAPAADPGRVPGVEGREPGPGEASGGRPLGQPGGRDGAGGAAAADADRGEPLGGGAAAHTPGLGQSRVRQRREGDPVPVGPERPGAAPADGRMAAEGAAGTPAVDAEGVEQRERLLGVVQQPVDGPQERGGPAAEVAWGRYGPAIRRWERVLGRPAPAPTESSEKGGHRLSPRFVEWMMGLPEGHVTEVPDLTRAEQLKALGNGVVPQQAAAAVRDMLGLEC